MGVPETDLRFCALVKLDDGVVKDLPFPGTRVGVGIGVADILCFVGDRPDIGWLPCDAEKDPFRESGCW